MIHVLLTAAAVGEAEQRTKCPNRCTQDSYPKPENAGRDGFGAGNSEEIFDVLNMGDSARAVASTNMNATSSLISNYHGSRCLNGKPGSVAEMHKLIAFVPQDDTMLATLAAEGGIMMLYDLQEAHNSRSILNSAYRDYRGGNAASHALGVSLVAEEEPRLSSDLPSSPAASIPGTASTLLGATSASTLHAAGGKQRHVLQEAEQLVDGPHLRRVHLHRADHRVEVFLRRDSNAGLSEAARKTRVRVTPAAKDQGWTRSLAFQRRGGSASSVPTWRAARAAASTPP